MLKNIKRHKPCSHKLIYKKLNIKNNIIQIKNNKKLIKIQIKFKKKLDLFHYQKTKIQLSINIKLISFHIFR